MKRMIRKIGSLCSVILLAILLTGCLGASVEDLMTLPQMPAQDSELSQQIGELLKRGYEYAAPLTGRNIQSVQMVDLDGDGEDEALAFFRMPSDEKQMKIYVFHREEESYVQLCTIESAGTGINSIYYEDVTGDGKMELVVGWRISTDVQTVAVYSVEEEPTALMRRNYTRFSIEELDGDGIPSLLLLRTDSNGNSMAEFYTWHDESMSMTYHCALSSDMADLSRGSVVSGKLTEDDTPAVFVTGVNTDGMAVTDILTYQKELGLVNIALDATTGRSKAVYKYCQLQPQDIDADGLVELPNPDEENDGIISWMNYDSNGNDRWAGDTYHCPYDDWYFDLPDDWHQRTGAVIMEGVSNENGVILQVDGDDVMAIYGFSGENRENRVTRNDYQVLERQPTMLYAAELYPAADVYGMDADLMQSGFHLITNFWLT